MTPPNNLFSHLPSTLLDEQVEILAGNRNTRIEKIISTGHQSPEGFWYDQEEHEWVTVLKGRAEVVFDDGTTHSLQPGDHLFIPAHRKHRVQWTAPNEATIWVAVFFPPDHPISNA